MRAAGLIVAVATLAFAPLASGQTDPQPAPEAEQAIDATQPPEPPTEADDIAVETAPEPDTDAVLICRTVLLRTESRLRSARERVCRTQAQWDALDQQAAGSRGRDASRNNN